MELLRKQLDDYGCDIFADFQKAFGRSWHTSKKLEHYGIRGISNKWFASYLTNID